MINKELFKKANIKKIISQIVAFIRSTPYLFKKTLQFFTFFVLLVIFITSQFFTFLSRVPLLGRLLKPVNSLWKRTGGRFVHLLVRKIEKTRDTEVGRLYLIRLAYHNLLFKKTRSLVTILGMSVGIGIIVLLLSLGYGIERLIISQVASLDELRMINVSAGGHSSLKLHKDILDKIKHMKQVEEIIPIVSMVGKVTYNKATTDVLVYSAPKTYFKFSKIKKIKGKLFSNNIDYLGNNNLSQAKVKGESTSFANEQYLHSISNKKINFNVFPNEIVTVWSDCDISSKVMGYTVRVQGGFMGWELWGGEYYPFSGNGRAGFDKHNHIPLGKWIKGKVPLYTKNFKGELIPMLDDTGVHRWEFGCMELKGIQIIDRLSLGEVLGESTSSAQFNSEASSSSKLSLKDQTEEATDSALIGYEEVVASGSGGLEFVSFKASTSASTKKNMTIQFQGKGASEAIVSSGLLRLLNIPLKKAVGLVLDTKLILGKNLIPGVEGKVLTNNIKYKIIGIIDDVNKPYFYISFDDANRLDVKNVSQVKVILKNKRFMPKIRRVIEDMGFKTSSTVDTVKQIENLFKNLRFVLSIIGLVALGVASLGMFNTLTVSLLERTREIGGMKTMGVVSEEVQDLFLAEAMIMGLSGGIGGLLLGFAIGKLISVVLSIFAITKGQGFLNLTYIPVGFIIFIITSSFVVGLITGLYPAQRAKKISALNALRYE